MMKHEEMTWISLDKLQEVDQVQLATSKKWFKITILGGEGEQH